MRVNLHYTLTSEEVDFVIDAINFVADHGHEFLRHYQYIEETDAWSHEYALVSSS